MPNKELSVIATQKLIKETVKCNKLLFLPMLCNVFELEESKDYDNDKILNSIGKYSEKDVKPSTTTSYSIDPDAFDP